MYPDTLLATRVVGRGGVVICHCVVCGLGKGGYYVLLCDGKVLYCVVFGGGDGLHYVIVLCAVEVLYYVIVLLMGWGWGGGCIMFFCCMMGNCSVLLFGGGWGGFVLRLCFVQ